MEAAPHDPAATPCEQCRALPFVGQITGVVNVTKTGSQAWAEGAVVYWDDTAKDFTTTASGNLRAGCAVVATGAGAGETAGVVRLNGIARPDEV